MTLVELLVVISIMLALVAVAIPMLRPILDRRPVREAARTLSGVFAAAQVRARETGRPAGVWIERFANHPQAAFTLYQAEVPPPYGGPTVSTGARLTPTAGTDPNYDYFTATINETLDTSLVHSGDVFQCNFQGPWYTVDTSAALSLTLKLRRTGLNVPWTATNSQYYPFQIQRQPVRTAARPIQLPGSTVIDLYASGTGALAFEPRNASDSSSVVVMFSPTGALDSVYCRNMNLGAATTTWERVVLSDPLYFLIGRRDRLLSVTADLTSNPDPAPGDSLAEDGKRNWEDLNNLWVTVFPHNGLVSVAEMADAVGIAKKHDPTFTGTTYPYDTRSNRLKGFGYTREYAREGQSLGGR